MSWSVKAWVSADKPAPLASVSTNSMSLRPPSRATRMPVRAAAAGIPEAGKRAANCFPEPLIASNERQNSWAICS